VKPVGFFAYINHAQMHSWNQTVLSNEGKVSCPRKQQKPLMGLEFTTDQLQIRCATQCVRPHRILTGIWLLCYSLLLYCVLPGAPPDHAETQGWGEPDLQRNNGLCHEDYQKRGTVAQEKTHFNVLSFTRGV